MKTFSNFRRLKLDFSSENGHENYTCRVAGVGQIFSYTSLCHDYRSRLQAGRYSRINWWYRRVSVFLLSQQTRNLLVQKTVSVFVHFSAGWFQTRER